MARRVFLGLTEVAGYFTSLQQGLRDLGVTADLHDLSANAMGYREAALSGDRRSGILRRAVRRVRGSALTLGAAAPGSGRRRIWDALLRVNRVLRMARAIAILPLAVIRYDTFVLAGGGMFLDGRELPLLRRLGKRIVVVFTGSDHRPPYLSGVWVRDAMELGFGTMVRDTRQLAARVARAERSAHAVVALTASAQFHRRPFADFLQVGYPFARPDRAAVPPTPTDGRAVRILHCPTKPFVKGSDRIREAIAGLQAEGFAIEYREITRRPHAEVLDALQWCDLVVDELYSDSPMAGVATEAAAYGRPAVVGGYLAAERPTSPEGPPSRFVHPDDLQDAIRTLLNDEPARLALGARAMSFVTHEWAPRDVASRILALADGEAVASWFVDPGTITYVNGWGMSQATLATCIEGLVGEYGTAVLQLGARPDLQGRLLALASAQTA